MKFDVVVGNPPYQESSLDRNRQQSIYPYFMDISYKIANKVSLITPARFLFNVGDTNSTWNKKMLSDTHLKVLFFDEKSANVFPNTDIKGGIVVTYYDSDSEFSPIGTFTPYDELNSILKKVDVTESVSTMISSTNGYRYANQLYLEFPEYKDLEKGGGKNSVTSNTFNKFKEIYSDIKKEDDDVQIYGRINNTRIYMWTRSRYIEKSTAFNKFKVLVPAANGSGSLGEVLSTPVIGHPLVGHTQTFISIGNFNNEYEANNLLIYLKSKFARLMLGTKKVTQNNKTKDTWSNVPLQDFTNNSDIDWSKSIKEIDNQLYKKYRLNQEEINFIESKVKSMS